MDNNRKSKNKIVIMILKTCLVLVWMCVVFLFSSQNGDASQNTSIEFVENILATFSFKMNLETFERLINIVEPIARKMAHFTLYTIGGILILNVSKDIISKRKRQILFTLLLGVLYAITDEVHQYFVPDRACRVFDVFIDSCGVVTGMIIYTVFTNLFRKCFKKELK